MLGNYVVGFRNWKKETEKLTEHVHEESIPIKLPVKQPKNNPLVLLSVRKVQQPNQPRSQGFFVVKHVGGRGPGKGWLIERPGKLQKLSTPEVAREIFQLY